MPSTNKIIRFEITLAQPTRVIMIAEVLYFAGQSSSHTKTLCSMGSNPVVGLQNYFGLQNHQNSGLSFHPIIGIKLMV
jgi:hypothetical protein